MSVILLLIPISLGLAVAFVLLCLASIRGGQFDDLESPRWRILFDETPSRPWNAAHPELPPLPFQGAHPRKNHETHRV